MENKSTTSFLPTKKDIIQRLFTEGHITFNEMWVLLQENEGTKFIPLPYPQPYNPYTRPFGPALEPYYYQTNTGKNE